MRSYNRQGHKLQSQHFVVKATGQVVDRSELVHAWSRQLSCPPYVTKGDFKRPNAWNYTLSLSEALSGVEFVENPVYTLVNSGIIGPESSLHPDVGAAVEIATAQAMERLNEKVRGSLDLAVSIAEGKQTVKMLNLVERYVNFVTQMRRSYLRDIWQGHYSRKRARQLPRRLRDWQRGIKHSFGKSYKPVRVDRGLVSRVTQRGADGWLEFTYGLSPLISDVRGIAENIIGSVRNYLFKFKAKGKQSLTTRGRVDGPGGHVGRGEVNGVVIVTYGVNMRPGFDSGLAQWTSINPLSVAYELIPYSFVLDWIVDLGGYMRNLETSLLYRSDFAGGYVSTMWTYSSSTTFGSFVVQAPGYTSRLSGACHYKASKFTRTVLTGYPLPQPPKLHPELGSSRLLSLASLLRQRLK